MMSTTVMPRAFASAKAAPSVRRAVVVRAEPKEKAELATPAEEQEFNPDASQPTSKDVTAVALDVPSSPVGFQALGRTQELINGRSAMLGFVAAVVSEQLTNQSVWSQIAGKYVDGDVVEKAHGMSTLYFGAIVFTVILSTLAPKLFENQNPEDREFGPFKAGLETMVGRTAMMGFLGLLGVEFVFGSSPLF